MHAVAVILGLALAAIAAADAFQTVVVARHGHALPLLTRLVYRLSWKPYAAGARLVRSEPRRDRVLGIYGPLSLLLLLAIWAGGLIVAFALFQWSLELPGEQGPTRLSDAIYFSAATFFTLGPSAPPSLASRYLMVLEAGFGFSFLGLVIGYLPVLYQSFSTRELRILLLDARAGSPPSAAQFIHRLGDDAAQLEARLAEWEAWALDQLQSHLSYPMLAYYRSQHTNQSWLAALTAVVDVSVLTMLASEGNLKRQAGLTFAAGRHALVHTTSVFRTEPRRRHSRRDRLPAAEFSRLRDVIAANPTPLRGDCISEPDLAKLRAMYEPYAVALGASFVMTLPPWVPSERAIDNWQVDSWGPKRSGSNNG